MRSRPRGEDAKPPVRSTDSPAAGGPSSEPIASSGIANVPGVAASARLIEFAHGLYGLSIGGLPGERRELAGLAVPATHIASLPADVGPTGVEIFAASASAGWLGPEGGTVGIKVPADRGHVLVTTYRLADQPAVPVEIQIARIDRPIRRPASAVAPSEAASEHPREGSGAPSGREVEIEIVLHSERGGDRRLAGGEWLGSRGAGQPIEAFSIRPLAKLGDTDIEYKAYGPGGRETPWVTAAKLCGTRGRGIALTGFAVRLAAQASERFDVVYEGAFAVSGITGPRRNGEPCTPPQTDDPLEAVRIRLVERAAG